MSNIAGREIIDAVGPSELPPKTIISVSADFAALLQKLQISLAFTSYQSGHLFLVGVEPGGKISIDQQRFERAMGLHWTGRQLLMATATQIIRFENMLLPGEKGDDRNDLVLVPRVSWTTNDVDAHEIAVEKDGRPLFVATKFNCVGTVDPFYSFAPVWMPPFITGSARGDKCHLNGLALDEGKLAYATIVGVTDEDDGWRAHRADGGILIDCRNHQILADGLSMPHSPRLFGKEVWLLESGTGNLLAIDRTTLSRRTVAFCPGFARGLSLGARHAVVTVSKPRDERFEGLPLENELAQRHQQAWCGIVIIDLETGDIPGWIRLDGAVQELFDVTALPGIRCPRSLGPQSKELWVNVRPRPVSATGLVRSPSPASPPC